MEKLDLIDDKIFEVICELNDGYKLGLDIESTDHTSLVIDARYILVNLIKEVKEQTMKKNKIDIIEKYVIDTITSWGYDSEYTKGIYGAGLDILTLIDKLKSFDDDDDINIKELW